MNDRTFRMAQEAGFEFGENQDGPCAFCTPESLARFAELVRAEKAREMIASGHRQCAEGQRTSQFCGQLEAAVAAEREACAKVCEAVDDALPSGWGYECARAIRARGEKGER